MGKGDSAFFCNVHMLMASQTDAALAEAMDAAALVFADGTPVAWLQRRLGHRQARVLRGYEALELICADAAGGGRTIGLFGASSEVLTKLSARLEERFEGLRIVYSHAPGVIAEDAPADMAVVEAIRQARPDYLFVGLGCPKQEKWIHRHRAHLDCSMLGVGAAFGWLAGTTRRPPRWMEKSGLGWLFRLATEPGRTARRYLVYNSRFLLAAAKLLIFTSKSSPDRDHS